MSIRQAPKAAQTYEKHSCIAITILNLMGLHNVHKIIQPTHCIVKHIFNNHRKIWDLWISEGYNVFYKVAMTVL
jgi:hypothetical protein